MASSRRWLRREFSALRAAISSRNSCIFSVRCVDCSRRFCGVFDRARAAGAPATSAHVTCSRDCDVAPLCLLRLFPRPPPLAERLAGRCLLLPLRLRPRGCCGSGGKLRSSSFLELRSLCGDVAFLRFHCRFFTRYGVLNLLVHFAVPVGWGPPHSLQCGLQSFSWPSLGFVLPHAKHTRAWGCGHTSLRCPIFPHVLQTSWCCLYRLHLVSTAPYFTVAGTLVP